MCADAITLALHSIARLLPRTRSGHHGKHEAAAVQVSPHALASALCSQVANGYLLKQDVEEIMVRISVAHTLEETLERSEILIESVFEDALQHNRLQFHSMDHSLEGSWRKQC